MGSSITRFFALLLFLVFQSAWAEAQSPSANTDVQTELPTTADIDNRLARRIASDVQRRLDKSTTVAPGRETLGFYGVEIDVQRDGSLEVTETITAYALGRQIRRGIYREFSLLNVERYQPSNPYTIISAKRDGVPINNWFTDGGSTFYQVYMGSKSRSLETGRWYTYELKYRVSKAILQFEDHDLLYWNAIPFHWAFPIRAADVVVRFPKGFVTRDIEIKAGRFGAKRDYLNSRWQRPSDNVVRVTANDLRPKNGITVMVKTSARLVDVMDAYPTADMANSLISGTAINDQGFVTWLTTKPFQHVVGPIGIAIIAIGLMILLWRRVGVDPPAQTVIPLYDPPRGLSAAGARYVYQFGFADPTHLMVTAVVSAATKGVINIDDKHVSGTLLSRTGASDETLSPGERIVLDRLMGGRSEFVLLTTTTSAFDEPLLREQQTLLTDTQNALRVHLDRELGAELFEWRLGYKFLFWTLALVAAVSAMFMVQSDSFLKADERWVSVSFLGLSLVLPFLLMGLREKWMINKASFSSSPLALAIDFLLCSFLACTVQFLVVFAYADQAWPQWQTIVLLLFPGAIAYGLGFSAFLMSKIIDSPTVQGTRAIAQVKGLRMYIAAAEEKLSRHLTPRKTPEQFTRLYPYAYALKLEAEWIEQFSDELARWVRDGSASKDIDWYHHNRSSHWGRSSSWTSSFSASVTSGVSYTPPSASGGVGGGGFGGGGGGGGGF